MPPTCVQPDRPWWTAFRRDLLRGYRAHHRRLPWRAAPGRAADPYHVLVSEAMLQQTQVATVIGYFDRFVSRWPTVRDLAAADEQQVLAAWQGLGYYRRARHLHRAARAIVDAHDGRVPASVEALLKLPGVGRYTAGAIASIAHQRPAPILDGNVKRVLARLFALDRPIGDRAVEPRLWSLAEAAVAGARRPGDVNQAIMELGATVCTPLAPRCLTCGVRRHCLAAARGIADQLPRPAARKPPLDVTHHVLAIERGGRFLFEQRPPDGLWGGMWQLVTREGGEPPAAGTEIGRFLHVTTHRRITFVVHHQREAGAGRKGVWRSLDDVGDLPMSNAQRKAIAIVRAPGAASRPRR